MGCLKIYRDREIEYLGKNHFFLASTYEKKDIPLKKRIDYYPFGLATQDSWTRVYSTPNKYLFNGGSELNSETQNYETFYRPYDPALGRFTQVDVLASQFSSWTPYQYAYNDPVYWNDVNGDCARCDEQEAFWASFTGGRHMSDRRFANEYYSESSFWAGKSQGGYNSNYNSRRMQDSWLQASRAQWDLENRAKNGDAAALQQYAQQNAADAWVVSDENGTYLSLDKEFYDNYSDGSHYRAQKISSAQNGGSQQAGMLGDDLFSTTGSLIGLKSLLIDGQSIKWDDLANQQKWKKSYNIHKGIKQYGFNVKTSTIKNGIPTAFKNVGRGLGAAAGLITVGDVLYNSQLKPSHILDATITGLSFIPGAGWAIGGSYLIIDIGSRVFTNKGIGDHLDAQLGGVIYDWDY